MGLSRVVNLVSGEERFYSLEPREAVIAAYAQSLGDNDTWLYEHHYGGFVFEGRFSFGIGSWACVKTNRARKAVSAC